MKIKSPKGLDLTIKFLSEPRIIKVFVAHQCPDGIVHGSTEFVIIDEAMKSTDDLLSNALERAIERVEESIMNSIPQTKVDEISVMGDRHPDKQPTQPEVKMPEVREICNLIIDSEDLKAAGVSIPEDQLEMFEEFLQDFVWNEIDLIGLLKKAANEFEV